MQGADIYEEVSTAPLFQVTGGRSSFHRKIKYFLIFVRYLLSKAPNLRCFPARMQRRLCRFLHTRRYHHETSDGQF
jgi:hypothetical protein